MKASHAAYQKARRAADPRYTRDMNLRTKFGLTLADYEAMYAEQEGQCELCGRVCKAGGNGGLVVDHDHKTGKVRSLLCCGCNSAIGLLKDDPELLEKAAEYVRYHQTPQIEDN